MLTHHLYSTDLIFGKVKSMRCAYRDVVRTSKSQRSSTRNPCSCSVCR